MIEREINEFLALKLEKGKTHIYVNGKKFLQCKRLVINIPKQSIPIYDSIDSIDEAADLHQKYLYQNKIVEGPNARILRDEIHDITPEQEFWGHCSNLQAWYEHNYDTRLIHSNLAFPLLKALVDAGDPDAKRVFKTEVAERFESGYSNAIIYIFETRLLDYFSPEEKKQLLQHNFPVISIYIENVSKHYPNFFLFIFEDRLLNYLSSEEKTQLMQLNYPVIVKWIQKMSKARYSPKKRLYRFKDILFDHLNAEEIKQLIQQNFPVILKDIKKIGKHYPHLFLYFFEERLLHYLSREEKMLVIQKNYPVILSYIQKTSKHDPDKFLYIVNAGILEYLLPEIKRQLIHQNYLFFFKNLHKILDPEIADHFEFIYPKILAVIFEERLFDYLNTEEKTQLIQQNFPVLLICIKTMTKDFRNAYVMNLKSKRIISSKTICYVYLTVINAIKGTNLLDDFFKAILEAGAFRIILTLIDSIKKKQELNQSESIEITENENLNETSTDNWEDIFTSFMNAIKAKRERELKQDLNQEMKLSKKLKKFCVTVLPNIDCKKCYKFLPPESLLILLKKERVYCPNCGRLVRKKFNPEVRTTYLEEVERYFQEVEWYLKERIQMFRSNGIYGSSCPMCGAVRRDLKKIEDKSKVLYYVSVFPMYVKKYVCKRCGYELLSW